MVPLLSVPVTPVLEGGAMGGLVMTDPFHRYRPGPRRAWGYFIQPYLVEQLSSACWTSFQRSILIFLWIFSKLILFISPIYSVCGDIESNAGSGSDLRVRVLYSNIRCLHANLDKLVVAGSDYDVFVCAECKVSDRGYLSKLRIPGLGCLQQRLRNSTPCQGWLEFSTLGKNSTPFGRVSWIVLATSLVCFVFAVG